MLIPRGQFSPLPLGPQGPCVYSSVGYHQEFINGQLLISEEALCVTATLATGHLFPLLEGCTTQAAASGQA